MVCCLLQKRNIVKVVREISVSCTNTFPRSARLPQIWKNYKEKSCEGLALLFFLLSLTGNFTYGASLFAYSQDGKYLLKALPWLLGSLGTMVEDCIIFVQFRIYAPKRVIKTTGSNGAA
jgi:uncharacterized protein with PQ loop repeat